MGWLNAIFSTSNTIDDVFDKDSGHLSKVGAWIGNSQFTSEEQAEMMQAFVIETLNENTDRSKTRRDVAMFVMRFYALVVFMVGMTYPISEDWSDVWLSIATLPPLAGLVLGVGAFFFGTHTLRSWQAKSKKEA